MLVWSWDNLSSKAVLHEHPDHLLVWNELQVDEAERLQGIPRDRVHALGAPSFDEFFAALETVERPAREGKTILYLGSSMNISREEPEAVFPEWLAAVRAAPDSLVREAKVVVRPYPGGGAWRRWRPESADFTVERGKKLAPAGLARALAARRRGRRAEHERRTRSGDRRPAGRHVPRRGRRARAGGLRPFRVPAGAERRLRDRLSRPRRACRATSAASSEAGTTASANVRSSRASSALAGIDRPVSPAVAEAILERAAR